MTKKTSAETLLRSFTTPQPDLKTRLATGKALREQTPRASHAEYAPRKQRKDPVSVLLSQAKTRLPGLVPVRHARMLTSSFAFLRGSAAIMAADLAHTPSSGHRVQACGDMHVSNFGFFATAERNLVFAINDFDETYPAPWEWDVKRLAVSAAVAARFLGGDAKKQEAAVRAIVEGYGKHIGRYAKMGHLAIWYDRIDVEDVMRSLSPDTKKAAEAAIAKARKRGHVQVQDKMTELVNDQRRIVEQRPFIARETHTENGMPIDEAIGLFLDDYIQSLSYDRRILLSRYRIQDVARKVVGVGSVGTRCWVVLMQGADEDDPLMLQVKEAQPSVLAPFVDVKLPYPDQGRRVVVGQRMIQGSPDIFLGWANLGKMHFYVRQLRDMKGGAELEPGKTPLDGFAEYCQICGRALALAHAKSGDPAVIAGYIGKSGEFEDAITKFAFIYAEQNEEDYARMQEAARSGDIAVQEAVD